MTPERLQRLAYVGNFSPCKAPEVVADVANRILSENHQTTMTWVCESKNHGNVRAMFDDDVQSQLEVYDWMPRQKLVDVYDNSGIFIFPSIFEGFGKAPLEAMSRGAIPVASRVGGLPRYVQHGVSGFLTDPGQRGAIADHIRWLLNHPVQAREMSVAAQRVVRDYRWTRCAAEAAEFYRVLLDAKPKSI